MDLVSPGSQQVLAGRLRLTRAGLSNDCQSAELIIGGNGPSLAMLSGGNFKLPCIYLQETLAILHRYGIVGRVGGRRKREDEMDFESILREAGANVRPQDDESHRPEVMNILLAIPDQIIGMTIPEMVASAWPTDSLMAVAARLSRRPWNRLAEKIRECLLGEGWYWCDTPSGRRWFEAEADCGAWVESPTTQ